MTWPPDQLRWQPTGGLPAQGQLLPVPTGHGDWIYLTVASEAGTGTTEIDETVWLHYRGGVDQEYLRSLDGAPPWHAGSLVARVGVPRRDQLVALRLPNRPQLRVLAVAYAGYGHEGTP